MKYTLIAIIVFGFGCNGKEAMPKDNAEPKKQSYGLNTDSLGVHQVIKVLGTKFELNTYVKTDVNQFHLHSEHFRSQYYNANYPYDIHLPPASFEVVKTNKPIEFAKAKTFWDSVINYRLRVEKLQDSAKILNEMKTPLIGYNSKIDNVTASYNTTFRKSDLQDSVTLLNALNTGVGRQADSTVTWIATHNMIIGKSGTRMTVEHHLIIFGDNIETAEDCAILIDPNFGYFKTKKGIELYNYIEGFKGGCDPFSGGGEGWKVIAAERSERLQKYIIDNYLPDIEKFMARRIKH